MSPHVFGSASEACSISPLTGEIREAEREHAYRQQHWSSSRWLVRVLGISGGAFFLLGFLVDVQLVHDPVRLRQLLAIRCAVAVILAAGALLIPPSPPRPDWIDRLCTGAQLLVSAAVCVIIALSPGSVVFHALTVIVVLLIFHLYVPNRWLVSTSISLLLSIAFLLIADLRLKPLGEELTLVVLFLLLVNLLGALSGHRVRVARRERFLTLESERRASRELDREMKARIEVEAALRASEMRHRHLVETSPYAILVHRNFKVIYANSAAYRLVSADHPEQIEGEDISRFLIPDSQQKARERIATLRSAGDAAPPVEMKIRTLDGRVVDIEVASSVAQFVDGPAIQTVAIDITESKRLRGELMRLATIDMLTGAANRHSFFIQGEAEIRRARRHHRDLALIMFDIDFFKQVNDLHGHAVGDEVLASIGSECRALLRAGDLMGRIGGEEFAVLLPEIDAASGMVTAQRLRDRIAALRLPAGSETVRVTVSVGVVALHERDLGLDDLLRRADRAMYEAKASGRDRTVCQ